MQVDIRDKGSIPGLGRFPGGGHGNPLQYSCLENSRDQRRLAGYSPWGRKKSDTTEMTEHAHSICGPLALNYYLESHLPLYLTLPLD